MSVVLDMLTNTEEKQRVNPSTWTMPDTEQKISRSASFALDVPMDVMNDFYDLKEYIRIANQYKKVRSLAIANSSTGEGSSTIATYLAFLMGGGLLKRLEKDSIHKDGEQASFKTPSPGDARFAGDTPAMQNLKDVSTDDFNWEESVDSRYVTDDNSSNILLVDANLHQPSLHKYFGVDAKNGLAEIIEQNRDWTEAAMSIKDSNLKLITAGETSINPAELLGSDRFLDLVRKWKQQFRYVIFDSPSVLNHTDALSLASTVDGVVLVVRAGQTRWDNAQSAKRKLSTAQANLLGVTLNRQKNDIPDGLYKKLV